MKKDLILLILKYWYILKDFMRFNEDWFFLWNSDPIPKEMKEKKHVLKN